MSMNAVTEQVALTVGFFGSSLTVTGAWLHRRIRRHREAVRYGQAVTERLPKYQEPSKSALLVVAGTYDEYQRFCASRRLNRFYDAALVQYSSEIRQRPGSRYVLIGSCRELANLDAILNALTYTGCKPE